MNKPQWGHNVGAAADPARRQTVVAQLLRQGVSQAGAEQLLEGGVVASPGDRVRLAQIVKQQIGFAIAQPPRAAGMLLPAVQAARATSKKSTTSKGGASDQQLSLAIERKGVSAFGVKQFLAGVPVTSAEDRQKLAAVAAAAAGAASGHPGGVNMVMLDGSVR